MSQITTRAIISARTINIGDKVIDLEENLWGIVWRRSSNGARYEVRWCDGSVSRGLHDVVLTDPDAGYILEDS